MNRIKYIHPNQKLVTIHKAPTDKDHVYGVLNKDAMYEACNNLSHNELKLVSIPFQQPRRLITRHYLLGILRIRLVQVLTVYVLR